MLQRSSGAIGFIKPCLPSPAKAPPTGADWLHEIKHDGFRILALRDAAGVGAPLIGDKQVRQCAVKQFGAKKLISLFYVATTTDYCSFARSMNLTSDNAVDTSHACSAESQSSLFAFCKDKGGKTLRLYACRLSRPKSRYNPPRVP
jgi:hypothetical protein